MKQYKLSTMVDYHYNDNITKKLLRSRRMRLSFVALFLFLLVGGAIVVLDSLRSKTVVINKTENRTLGELSEQKVFETNEFVFDADKDWIYFDRVKESDVRGYIYKHVVDGLVRRRLTIYVDAIPENKPLTYVLPITFNDGRIEPLGVSPHCRELITDTSKPNRTISTWFGINFVCTPDSSAYLVGTATDGGYGLQIAGTNAVHRYFFVYLDSADQPDMRYFTDILQSFRAK